MKKLKDILYKVKISEVVGSTSFDIDNISIDSREISSSDLFIAIQGVSINGHEFIARAIDNGAVAIVCESLPESLNSSVTYIKVGCSRESLSVISSNYYNIPSEKLKLVGITGTNGKTTVATLLFNLFYSAGYKVGLISTVVNRINEKKNKFYSNHSRFNTN